ncbi:citrate lyase beta subunit [Pisolithus thermaeus]|nr:citrate lyase beta subunit [Pisolithus thermaeus]
MFMYCVVLSSPTSIIRLTMQSLGPSFKLASRSNGGSILAAFSPSKVAPSTRSLSTSQHSALRRSYLYVPAASDRMLAKSLSFGIPPDVVIYDLEDSVPPSSQDKINARQRLCHFLGTIPADKVAFAGRIAVRVNDVTTPFFEADMSEVLKSPAVGTLVLPKINSTEDLDHVSRTIYQHSTPSCPLRIVASLESARSIWNLRDIVQWKSKFGAQNGGQLGALLFASEDYCADTSVVRTTSRQELLFVRSQIVIAAKASGLEAIDMVCIDYKDSGYLRDECEDARRLGFTGKQVIHPAQVETVNATFLPTEKEILRAANIIHQMDAAYASEKGAFGLEVGDGRKEMIDAPMLKQAKNTIQLARAAGLEIPKVS